MPLYDELAQQIRDQIASGELKPGQPLPSMKDYKEEGWAYGTYRSAILILKAEGLVVGRQGKGVYVRAPDG
jgi:GntR family transcriptional regulator